MLTLCGQQFEKVWTDFGGGVTRTAEWRASVNEMGEIPVLEDDGERLTQTAPILLRLAERYGKFQGDGEAERFEVLRWLFWDNHKLTATMATYRFLRTYSRAPDQQVLAFLRRRLDDYLRILQGHLETRAFVAGDRPTVADLSMIGYLYFPKDESGYDLATHPGHPGLARSRRGAAGMGRAVRPVAGAACTQREVLPCAARPSTAVLGQHRDTDRDGCDRQRWRDSMKIVVIGGSGLIGTKLVNMLRQRNHEVVAASPSSGVNALTGEGLDRGAGRRPGRRRRGELTFVRGQGGAGVLRRPRAATCLPRKQQPA